MDQVTQPTDRRDEAQFTIRHMFVNVALAAFAVVARKALSPVSPTLSWVAFGVILIGGLSLVTESARGLFRKDIRLVLPRVLLMLFVGGVCGYLVARG